MLMFIKYKVPIVYEKLICEHFIRYTYNVSILKLYLKSI